MMDTHRGSRTIASPRLLVGVRSGAKRARGERGQAAIEFTLVLPVLLTIFLGTMVFGLMLNNYLELTYATASVAQQLAVSRGITTPNPCTTGVTNGFLAAAPLLNQARITPTVVVGTPSSGTCPGTSCTAPSQLVA